MKSNIEIAAEAHDATRHPSNPPFSGIRNPNFRNELINEVVLAEKGLSDGRGLPFHNEVARLVAERNVERETLAAEEAKPKVAEITTPGPADSWGRRGDAVPIPTLDAGVFLNPDAPNLPHVDDEGNPIPTPVVHDAHAVEDAAVKANAEIPDAPAKV